MNGPDEAGCEEAFVIAWSDECFSLTYGVPVGPLRNRLTSPSLLPDEGGADFGDVIEVEPFDDPRRTEGLEHPAFRFLRLSTR